MHIIGYLLNGETEIILKGVALAYSRYSTDICQEGRGENTKRHSLDDGCSVRSSKSACHAHKLYRYNKLLRGFSFNTCSLQNVFGQKTQNSLVHHFVADDEENAY